MTQVDYQVNLGLVRLPSVEKSYKKIWKCCSVARLCSKLFERNLIRWNNNYSKIRVNFQEMERNLNVKLGQKCHPNRLMS